MIRIVNLILVLEVDELAILENRAIGAFITFSLVIILWIVLGIFLLKPEPKVKNVNMAGRYREISLEEFNKFGIDIREFKKVIYQKFMEIHIALNDMDMDVLKRNLTDDLYKSYVVEINNLKKKNRKIVSKDFDLRSLKIYNIYEIYGLLHIDVYLNVRMLDCVIDVDTGKCISGNGMEKMDFEFELHFTKKMDMDEYENDYLLSKKTCVNKMKIDELNNK